MQLQQSAEEVEVVETEAVVSVSTSLESSVADWDPKLAAFAGM